MKHSDEERLMILRAKIRVNRLMRWRRQDYLTTVYNRLGYFPRELVDEAIAELIADGLLTDTERSKNGVVLLTYVSKEAA